MDRQFPNNAPHPSRKPTMDRNSLGQVVLRLQAQFIRASLAEEIAEFEKYFQEILETTSVFLVSTERVSDSPSLVVVDQAAVVKTVCHFLASSNAILEFLHFQRIRTGLAGGGDRSLEKQVKDAQAMVGALLNTLILYRKAESYPGKTSGLVYDEDVTVFGNFILHKNRDADPSDVPDPNDNEEDMGKLIQYWHTEGILHPLRHVPGTAWHKFFGNIKPGPIMRPALFRERKPLPSFKVIFPQTISWLKDELIAEYDKYRHMFERFRRLPGPRLPENIRHVSTTLLGFDEAEYLHLEDMSEIPCPEYDLFGMSRFEALNAELNTPELAGIALLGADVPPVPVILMGQPTRYCLQFDGLWDF
ncbi:mat A-2 [Staphylotrichum tortipilum]|uniref:Mat A-2 n=1 Tax=Staphylotrichum tortipilum TaxID=2831512 RepID=A0AAN6RVH4_9PEZI|nr:mat A-2 [Staphylotrichum longicolle]